MFQLIKRRLAIRSYRNKLGPYLEKQVGWRVNYSPQEVRAGASSLGLSLDSICYAYAMYCTPADFASHHAATGEHCDYATMHAETMSFGTGAHGDSSSHHDSGGGWFDSHGHDSHSHDQGGHHGGHDSGGGHDGGGGDGGSY
jgi:hypothetical protein